MQSTFVAWAISAAALVLLAVILGRWCTQAKSILGILVDNRGRMSLTHLQLTLWTLLILSLIVGVFVGHGWSLDFDIPNQVLGLMGITVGSTVAATITKSAKDNDPTASARIAVPAVGEKPKLAQVIWVEEGALADEVIDITKFQNFAFTVVLVVAYTALAIHAIRFSPHHAALTTLPDLPSQFLTLLGISHAGYIAGKLPNQTGVPGAHETVAGHNVRRQKDALVASQLRDVTAARAAADVAAALAAAQTPPLAQPPASPPLVR